MISLWRREWTGRSSVPGATLEPGTPRLFIRAPVELRESLAAMPGSRWSPSVLAHHVPFTLAAAEAVTRVLAGRTDVEMEPEVVDLFARAAQVLNAQAHRSVSDINVPVRTTPWDHQRRAFSFASNLDAAMLAMDMGTGKSLVTIALWEHFKVKRGLILCPVSVVGVWPKQFRLHALDPDEWLVIAPMPGAQTISRKLVYIDHQLQLAQAQRKRVALVLNYEAAWRSPMSDALKGLRFDDVVCDESHRIKSAGGKAALFATAMGRRTRHRGAATGTPMPHSPVDIYAQYRFLDPAIFGTSKNRFINRYAVTQELETRDGQRYSKTIEYQNMEEFTNKYRSIAFIVTKEEALPDLPPKLPTVERDFELSPKALRLYRLMAKDLIAEVERNEYIVAANSLVKVMRLRQITSGYAPTDTGGGILIDESRMKALVDILEDLPEHEPLVIFAVFRHDLDSIREACIKTGRKYGELSGRRRDGLTHDSTMAVNIDVLGCQLKSGGVGIDLTRAATAVYYSVGYELGDYMQSQDRLHRPGQTRPVTYIHMVASNVDVDRIMFEALEAKRNVVDAIRDAARAKQL